MALTYIIVINIMKLTLFCILKGLLFGGDHL
jgi:hypothetical protein